MKTSSKIILEDMKLSNEFRFNIELLDNDNLKKNLFTIMSNLDDFNNEKSKESNKLASEYLFKKQVIHQKQQKTIERLKAFIEVDRENANKTSNKSQSKEPSLSSKEKEIMRKLNL